MMNKKESTRRSFVKLSTAGIGGLAFSSFARTSKVHFAPDPSRNPVEKKLNIMCVGAHPGDPEFGCGGTLARYSDAGHQVSRIDIDVSGTEHNFTRARRLRR